MHRLETVYRFAFITSVVFSSLFSTACTSTSNQMKLSSIGESKSPTSSDTGTDLIPPSIQAESLSYSNVNQTQLTISWDAASDQETEQAQLEYKLICSENLSSIDTLEKAEQLDGESVVMNYMTNRLTWGVTGLSPSSTYYFAVIVKDADENKVLYTPKSVTTVAAGTTAPPEFTPAASMTNSADLSITLTSPTSSAFICYTIDGSTPVISASSCGVGMLINSGDTVSFSSEGDHTLNAIAGLAGFENSAVTSGSYRIDRTPPVVPCAGSCLDFSEISNNSVKITHQASTGTPVTDNLSLGSGLSVKLVQALASADIDTVAEVDAITGGQIIINNVTLDSLPSYGIAENLDPSTDYYFAFLIKDESGNATLSAPQAVTTNADPVPLQVNDLVITEFLQENLDPSVNGNAGQYIEIYNNSNRTITFAETPIKISLEGNPSLFNITSGTVNAGDYFVVCRQADPEQNGGVACDQGELSFTIDETGTIEIHSSTMVSIDWVEFSSVTANRAWELDVDGNDSDNSSTDSNWHLAYFPFGGNGENKGFGTPGSINSRPILISEVMRGANGKPKNEFIELYNPNAIAVNLQDAGYRLSAIDLDNETTFTHIVDFNDANDFKVKEKEEEGDFPSSMVIEGYGYYLLVHSGAIANEPWTNNADAFYPRSPEGGHKIYPDQTYFLTIGEIPHQHQVAWSQRPDNLIDHVGCRNTLIYSGTEKADDMPVGKSIERKALPSSTADGDESTGLFSGGGHADKGNGHDTDSGDDFVVRSTPDPQGRGSTIESPE